MAKLSKLIREGRAEVMAELESLHGFKLRPLPRFPAIAVSDDGRVWDVWPYHLEDEGLPPLPPEDRYAAPYIGKSGYEGVWLRQGKRRPKYHMVHKLVALAFLGTKPGPKYLIRHLNGDCHDNRASNLKWGTAAENAADRVEHAKAYNRLTPRQRTNISKKVTQDTRHDLAKKYNVSFQTINNIWKKTQS